ncbi:glycerol kinase [Mycoplasma wenyonii str. Massachusetts]|uniref:Glycerol kinase n=1 Tax=Mycoplasma wenyonii (strain Massachusetts) TaxID=1197325 RepID=I6ZFE9_MYCWM|nr:FGGY family carbohydrate kinase [Mycoplasma wenyonii]AFN65332.1 glycerol kinase [Mycoplasma wenyonii str. Massachusetts]
MWVSSYCSAPKFNYLIKEVIPCLNTEWLWGTLDCWLIYLLSEGRYFVTDYVSASRTALLNLKSLEWDKELCELFEIPREKFPSLCENAREIGSVKLFGKYNLILKGVIGDQQGALYTTYRLREEGGKLPISLVYGTGAFLLQLLPSGKTFEEIYSSLPENSPLSISLAWVVDSKASYALELGISNSGKALEWLLSLMKLQASEIERVLEPENINWESLPFSIPTLSSKFLFSTPENYSASIFNLCYESKEKELIVSFLESMSFSVKVATELLSFNPKRNYIVVGGGLSKNTFFLELQSSCLDCPLTIYQSEHLSGLGSAFLTFPESSKIPSLEHKKIIPNSNYSAFLNKRFKTWKKKLKVCQVI